MHHGVGAIWRAQEQGWPADLGGGVSGHCEETSECPLSAHFGRWLLILRVHTADVHSTHEPYCAASLFTNNAIGTLARWCSELDISNNRLTLLS